MESLRSFVFLVTFIYCITLSHHLTILKIDFAWSKIKVLIVEGRGITRFWIVIRRIGYWWIILKVQLDLFHLNINSFIIRLASTSQFCDGRRRWWRTNFKRSIIWLLGRIRALIIKHSSWCLRQPHLIGYIAYKFGHFNRLRSLIGQTISLFFLTWKAAALCDSIWFMTDNSFILETLHFWTLHLILWRVRLSELLSFYQLAIIVVFIFLFNQLHFYNQIGIIYFKTIKIIFWIVII